MPLDPNALSSASSQFGVINALRTGNVVLDMMICMMIPVAFKLLEALFQRANPILNDLMEKLRRSDDVCLKSLDYEFRTNSWGRSFNSGGKEERNNILQKAVMMFIGEMKGLEMNTSKLSFMAVKEKGQRNEEYEMEYGSTVEQLEQYKVATLPQHGAWIDVAKGLRFRQTLIEPNEEGQDKIKKTTIRFEFEGVNPGGAERIDKFIDEAFVAYKNKMKALADHSRYLYMLVKSPSQSSSSKDEGGDDGDGASSRVYKRYKLSDEKSFDCLFFKEKKLLLKLMSHFMEKTGKYAIKGFPHKLGLLLHGPPGTGKTSLIKAMAQHTGRNVVSIPLARIETNQELMDIVFDQSFAVKGEDMPIKLSFKDTIFVMEDVDAASPIVHSRKEDKSDNKSSHVAAELDTHTTRDESNVESKDVGKSEDKDMMAAVLNSLAVDSDPLKTSKYMSRYDKLDLAGLLNVLDGVVDCPNRILIMTTNHPEKLDAALIRPGRIDKIIYLGYIQYEAAAELLEHYFEEPLLESQQSRLKEALNNPPGVADITPAELEQLCAEYETVEEFLKALEEKVAADTAQYFATNGGSDLHEMMPPEGSAIPSLVRDHTIETLPGDVPPMRRGLSALDEPH